jgi:hypothetical protein
MGSDKINSDVKNPRLSWEELTAGKKPEIESLLNQCFPVEAGQSFFDDFPVWDPSQSVADRNQILGRNESGQAVCSASARVVTLVLDEKNHTRVGLIGAVASDPQHRGQGHASAAIEKILNAAVLSDPKIECIVLWGSEKNLYSRFGFDYGGIQKRASLGNLVLPEFLPDPTLDVQMGWDDDIFLLMQKRHSGVSHSSSDLTWLKSHPNVVWFRIIRNGSTTAYVGVNRGIDLMGIVHEWGGSELDLGILFSAMKIENPNLQVIYHPEHEKSYAFFKRTEHFEVDRLCMVKWLGKMNPKTLERLWFFGLDSG